jgi:hypothetical protein
VLRLASAVALLGLASSCGATLGGEGASAPVTVDVVVPSAPPPDRTDPPRPPAPAFGQIWVAGHWDNLDGIYVWKEGRWVPGRADYEYVRARYDFDGAKQSWIYHRPHWKRRHAAAAQLPAPNPSAPTPDAGA